MLCSRVKPSDVIIMMLSSLGVSAVEEEDDEGTRDGGTNGVSKSDEKMIPV